MEKQKHIPTPEELLATKYTYLTPIQEELVDSLLWILTAKFNGSIVRITLEEISSHVKKDSQSPIRSNDRDVLERVMIKNGRSMEYDGPGYSESYAAYFKVGTQK